MKKIVFSSLILILLALACTRDNFIPTAVDCDEDVPPTYDGLMKEIVDLNCAYNGCHDGTAPGNYTSYAGMQVHFGGSLEDRVIDQLEDPVIGMPPNNAAGPTDLSEEHLIMFTCWIDAEFPEF